MKASISCRSRKSILFLPVRWIDDPPVPPNPEGSGPFFQGFVLSWAML